MNIKGKKQVLRSLLTILALTFTCHSATASSLAEINLTTKHKNSPSTKGVITCDSYPRQKLLSKAAKYQEQILSASREYKVSPHLITAVITVESCFIAKAKSSAGAAGLMQLMPATAKRFGVTDRYNTNKNIEAGTKYLQFLLNRFDGNVQLAAAAYNAGEGSVDKHNGVPPYKETQAYVKRVLNAYRKLANSSHKNRPSPRRVAPTQKSRSWYIAQYERNRLLKGLKLSSRELEHVDQLLRSEHVKPVLSLKHFL